jgi:hypothetical protein
MKGAYDSGRRPASLAKAPRGLDPGWRPHSIGLAGPLVERFSRSRASTRPELTETSVNVRGDVHAYLPPEHYRRLKLEAAARQVSLSQCVADCLGEYFALRQEMATALETPAQPRELSRRVIHVLLAETEQRLVATFERYVDDLAAVREAWVPACARASRASWGGVGSRRPSPHAAPDPHRSSAALAGGGTLRRHGPRRGPSRAKSPWDRSSEITSPDARLAGTRRTAYLAVHLRPFTEYCLNRLH